MKRNLFQKTTIWMGNLTHQQVRMILVLGTLLLFVLGAGAPEGEPGWTGG